jgi:hypothetical protein
MGEKKIPFRRWGKRVEVTREEVAVAERLM